MEPATDNHPATDRHPTGVLQQYYNAGSGAYFVLLENKIGLSGPNREGKYFRVIWNRSRHPLQLSVDDQPTQLQPHQVIFLTYLQKASVLAGGDAFFNLMFNPAFYCIHTNDKEVSCNGLLFFGSNATPLIFLDSSEIMTLQSLLHNLQEEFETIDTNQEEMLRILLKRLIIRCTRLARKQWFKTEPASATIDTIRQFIIYVEEYYKQLHKVSDYSAMLNKSAKTITNTFSLFWDKSPLQVIHERIVLEAKRQLLYTNKSLKQISYELGFEDPSQFSRLFRNISGENAIHFKKKHLQTTPVGQK